MKSCQSRYTPGLRGALGIIAVGIVAGCSGRDSRNEHTTVPVEIVTAPDFTEFARRAMAQDYDIAITTGHQARLL